jgi:hypothetical protein
MVLESKVLNSNLDSVIHLIFNYISRVGSHLLKGSLSLHGRRNVKILIKLLNLLLRINLNF